MNLTAPISLLAALTAINNPSSDQKADVRNNLKCYDCGEKLADNTWCNHPKRNNVPSSGTTICHFEDAVCAEAVYSKWWNPLFT